MDDLRFQVDTRIASLLSENYRSPEKAIKELVDNAWDADADTVIITLPEPMTLDSVIIEDDGSGMTDLELKREYLVIASDRRKRRGERTFSKQRLVKGRKGIGKFAGLMTAKTMKLETWARGMRHEFQINLDELSKFNELNELPLKLISTPDTSKLHGTRITLSDLNQTLRYPNAIKFRQLLIQEYGRETGFNPVVNGKPLASDDIQGNYSEINKDVPSVGLVDLKFTISDQKGSIKQPGISIRVDGKVIGEPSFFGLDKSEDIPPKLLGKIFGEVVIDGLADHVTADWGALIDGSEKYSAAEEIIKPILREKLKEVYAQEINLAQARLKKKVNDRLANLPEYKREYADKAIKKILERFYQEPESKMEPIVNVLLDAIERSEYRTVLEHINDAKHWEVSKFADAMEQFGMIEMANMVEQSNARIDYLTNLQTLCDNPDTLEKQVHKAVEKNLWLIGPEYSLFSSNQTLKKLTEDYLDKKYQGTNADSRPDLLLNKNLSGEYLLIEFKRPSHSLTYADYQQATKYRNDLLANTGQSSIKIWLVGGKKGSGLPADAQREPGVNIVLYNDLISTATNQLNWLVKEMSTKVI